MYDVVGGGFHRYSVDDRWLVPHFEKMLYDNALLASTYLHAWVVTGRDALPRGRRGDRRLHAPGARAPGRRARLRPGRGHRGRRGAHVHVDRGGGGGRGHPERAARAVRARAPRSSAGSSSRICARGCSRFATSALQPFRDDKALASWNGLALAAIAEAAYRLERDDWLAAARDLGEFLLGPLSDADGRLFRSVRDGRTSGHGFLDDYANVANGLIELHVATGDVRWLLEAHRLALLAVELFGDEAHGGFYLAPADGDARVPRTKDLQDTPIPSGNSMLAWVLLRLSRHLGRRRARAARGRRLPARGAGACGERRARSRGRSCGLDLWFSPPREIAIAGDVTAPVARAALAPFQPNAVVAVGPSEDVPLLAGKDLVDERDRRLRVRAVRLPATGDEERRSYEGLPDDRGPGGRHLGRLGAPRDARGAARARRASSAPTTTRRSSATQAGALDAWATLAGLAAVTKRIRLGTLVSPATFRHPSVLARMAVTVDHISGGRVEVGLGLRLVRARARRERLPVPRREGPLRALRGAGRGRRAVVDGGRRSTTRAPRTPCRARRRCRSRCSSRIRRSSSAAASSAASRRSPRATRPRSTRSARRTTSCARARSGSTGRAPRRDAIPATLGFSVMTSCFVGADRAEVVERVRRFLEIAGGGAMPEAVIAERATAGSSGTVDEVAARIEELRAIGVTRRLPPAPEPLRRRDGRPDRRRARCLPSRRVQAMTTTEITGAEDVAWDLSDLYDGSDDPRLEAHIEEAETRRSGLPRALLRQGREPLGGGARRRDRRARAHRGGADARRLLRAPALRDRHGRPAARRARRPHHGEGRRARHAAPLLRAGDRGDRGRRRGGAARGAGARALAPLDPLAAQVPAAPPLRARGEDRHREERLGRQRLGPAVRGAPRRAPGGARRRGDLVRGGDVEALLRRPRRPPRRGGGGHPGARARSADAHVRLQHDPRSTSRSTTACAGTRPGSRPATCGTTRRTRPCRR